MTKHQLVSVAVANCWLATNIHTTVWLPYMYLNDDAEWYAIADCVQCWRTQALQYWKALVVKMYRSDDVVPLLIANVFLQSADLFFCNSLFFKNQDFMGKSDPYLEFSRPMPDGKLQAVHRTEVQMCHIVAVQCRLYHACSQFLLIFTYYMIVF